MTANDASTVAAEPAATPRRKAPIYRPDLDGLRGIAIAFVVFFHVWMGRVSGGVDVFLALSGFFFLGSLVRNATRPGSSLSPLPTLHRLIRRLWPVLAVVVAATVGLTVWLRPEPLWDVVFTQGVASLLYYQNWELAMTSQDYAAADASISPLQHLWSMSVQGQFYLLALVLVLGVALLFRLFRKTPSTWVYAVLFAAVVAASMWWATKGHNAYQSWNYYDTQARLWELFIGGLCAIAIGGIAFPWLIRFLATVVGLGMVVSCGLIFDGAALFPAAWALYPVGGALLIVVFGAVPEGKQVRPWTEPVPWFLSTKPVRRLGDLAYGLYLWHWPLLIIYLAVAQQPHASPAAGAGIIAVSLLLAWITERLIERPLRMTSRVQRNTTPDIEKSDHAATTGAAVDASVDVTEQDGEADPEQDGAADTEQKAQTATETEAAEPAEEPDAPADTPRRRIPIGTVAATLVVLLCGGAVFGGQAYWHATAAERTTIEEIDPFTDPRFPGAAAFLDGTVPEGTELHPSPVQVQHDLPASTLEGCIADFDTVDVVTCVYGDPDAERTIALVGGSHSEHWMTALDALGQEHGFRVVTILKMGCPLTLDGTVSDDNAQFYAGCTEWSPAALETIVGLAPDYVFTTATRPAGRALPDYTPYQYIDLWKFFSEHGIGTLAVRDTPWIDHGDGPMRAGECLAEPRGNAISCGMPRSAALSPENPAVLAASGMPDVKLLDFTDALCDAEYCPAVVGNVIVYHDSHHLSRTFVLSLVPEMERQLQAATGWW